MRDSAITASRMTPIAAMLAEQPALGGRRACRDITVEIAPDEQCEEQIAGRRPMEQRLGAGEREPVKTAIGPMPRQRSKPRPRIGCARPPCPPETRSPSPIQTHGAMNSACPPSAGEAVADGERGDTRATGLEGE